MRELGITPVFPPREDVQVGDIYMAPTTPETEQTVLDAKGYLPLGVWVSTANVKADLNSFYRARSSFPVTDKNSTDQPHSEADTIFDANDPKRLRLVGFPIFMSATLSQGSLSGLVPTEAVSVAAAAGFTKGRRITVSVPRAESYALPASLLIKTLTAGAASADKPKKWNAGNAGGLVADDLLFYLPVEQRASLSSNDKWEGNPFGYVRVITEVFYARQLDVSIEASRGAGLSLDVKPVVAVPATGLGNASPAPKPPPPSPAAGAAPTGGGNAPSENPTESSKNQIAGDSVKFTQPTPQEIAAELNKQLDTARANAAPGVGARFVTAGTQGIGMRVTFERPMAIGYRGVLLKLYKDGTLEGAGSLGSVLPTAKPPTGGQNGSSK